MFGRALAVAVCALAFAATANAAPIQQELTIPAGDGAKLSCALSEPGDPASAPAGGWPAVMLFHGLGGKHQDMAAIAAALGPSFASLACDARGHGASEGQFGLDGPRDVQDTKELFAWLTARPEVSDTQVGALGISLGGGAVWNALTNAVPFKAAVPIITWTNLATSLAPQDLSKSGLVSYLAGLVPTSRWAPDLLAASAGLTTSADLTAAKAVSAARSPLGKLASITTPTLLIQGRHDFLFDIDQAIAAYRALGGPRALYVGDLGHSPAPNPAAEQPAYVGLAFKWFDRYLKGTPNGIEKTKVLLAHDPYDGQTTAYAGLPATKAISVNLPGSTTIAGAIGKAVRSVRVTGGPHETFGDSTVTLKYSGAKAWDRLVAVLAVQGTATPITAGGAKVKGAAGTVTIRLMNEAVKFAAGKKLVLYLSSTSVAQTGNIGLYLGAVADPSAQVTIGKVTLKLSVLRKAVSR